MPLVLVAWAFVLGPAFCVGGLLAHLCDPHACTPCTPANPPAHSDRDGTDSPHGCHDDLCALNITSPQPLVSNQLRLSLASPHLNLPDPGRVLAIRSDQLAFLHVTSDCLPNGPPSLAGRITPLLI